MQAILDSLLAARPLLATLAGVAGLLALILAARMPAFPALLTAALFTGLAAGLAPMATIEAIQAGMGGTLGFIAVIVGLGALFSAFLEASGGARAVATALVANRPSGVAQWAIGLVGLIVAIPVFFDVGLILLIPLVIALAKRAKKPALYFGLPLLAGLATAHAFIPPTPGPIAVADILGADIGWVILFGLVAGAPAMALAGPIYARLAEKQGWLPDEPLALDVSSPHEPDTVPGVHAGVAIATILVPLILIVAGTIFTKAMPEHALQPLFAFVGHPFTALLIACGLAWWALSPRDVEGKTRMKDALSRALEPTAAIILVTGAGGAFKQVLVDSGAGTAMADSVLSLGITPLVAGFVLAALVRVSQGSATVAMLTAAGLIAPIASAASMSPAELALLTISIASGASIVSHVNDSGFWLVAKNFGLSVSQTFRTWTVSSTLVGVTGFAVALILSAFV